MGCKHASNSQFHCTCQRIVNQWEVRLEDGRWITMRNRFWLIIPRLRGAGYGYSRCNLCSYLHRARPAQLRSRSGSADAKINRETLFHEYFPTGKDMNESRMQDSSKNADRLVPTRTNITHYIKHKRGFYLELKKRFYWYTLKVRNKKGLIQQKFLNKRRPNEWAYRPICWLWDPDCMFAQGFVMTRAFERSIRWVAREWHLLGLLNRKLWIKCIHFHKTIWAK